MTNYYKGEIFRTADGKFYTNDIDGAGFVEIVSSSTPTASYQVYTALLAQSGTNAPTAVVLENTLGGTVVWGYESGGWYTATLVGAFKTNKTVLFIPSTISGIYVYATVGSEDTIAIHVGEESDDILSQTPFEIRVYN